MHTYEPKSFLPEQERKLRNCSKPSRYIQDFLSQEEFDMCRKLALSDIQWPEHGSVSKYWGFGWDSGFGPRLSWLRSKVNDLICDDWELDFLAIQEAINPWKLHADIRWYADRIPYKVILIPMDVEPIDGSVDVNDWPDTYSITFKQRNFLSRWQSSSQAKTGNDQSDWVRPHDDIQVEGIEPGYHISREQWQTYFSHMPYEHLEGLTLDCIHPWQPRSAFFWDNTAIHCADNFLDHGIKTKRSLMIFTILKNN